MSVRRNRGDGTFEQPSLAVATPTHGTDHLFLADLDGDGVEDLVHASRFHGMEWMRGTGAGLDLPVRVAPEPVEGARAVDWTLDGDLDLVWRSDDALLVAENQGNGQFDSARAVASTDGSPLALGDLDGDQRADAVFGPLGMTTVALQQPDGTLEAPRDAGFGRGRASAAEIRDLDGDGDGDLFVTDEQGHAVGLQTAGAFAFTPLSTAPLNRTSADEVDRLRTIEAPAGPPALVVAKNGQTLVPDGAGGFAFGPVVDLHGGDTANVWEMVTLDVDVDGLDDLVIQTYDVRDPPLMWLPNVGGALQPARRLPSREPLHLDHLATGDADGDGDQDLLVDEGFWEPQFDSGRRRMEWTISPEGTRQVAYDEIGVAPDPRASVWQRPIVADLDGDGDSDLLTAEHPEVWTVRENPGGLTRRHGTLPFVVAVSDLDGDGVADVLSQALQGPLELRRGLGAFTFAPPSPLLAAGPAFAAVIDVDLDGWPDVLTREGPDHRLVLYRNRGGALGPAEWIAAFTADTWPPEPLEAVDLDGDGDLEILMVDHLDVTSFRSPDLPPPPPVETGDTADSGAPGHSASRGTGDTGPATDGTDTGAPAPTATDPGGGVDASGCGCRTAGGAGLGWGAAVLVTLARIRRRARRLAPGERTAT